MHLSRDFWSELHNYVSIVLLVECSFIGAFRVNYTSQCIPSTTSRMKPLRGVWRCTTSQWRNVTIWCPPAHFLPPPQIFCCLQNKQKKTKKKGRQFFSVFLIGFLPPWSFLYPQIFFSRRPNAKLAEIWYILLLCQKIFRLKNCKFGNIPPP